jgi:hypothetical protein
MNRNLILLLTFSFTILNFVQAQIPPNAFNYSAVARGPQGQPIASQNIGIRFSILKTSVNGPSQYVETHQTTTDPFGLFNLKIGGGSVQSGNFASIDWGADNYFLKVELDAQGNINYYHMGTTQFVSVPYALYSGNSSYAQNGIDSISTNGDTLYLSNGDVFVNTSNGGGTFNLVIPTIITNTVTDITSNSATFGGVISNANGNQIMERGIVYSTSPNPTIGSNKIMIGSGIGTFDTILGMGNLYAHLLIPNTTYYARAYAVTENNISAYGNEVSFTTLSVGQAGPGGGIVFFNKGNSMGGWQYLETATSDQSTASEWGCIGTSIPGTQPTVGSGEVNTSLIVAGCNEASFAAKICDNLSLGGQSDWFLPSIDELNLMYVNLHFNNQGNFNTSSWYWSSSEESADCVTVFGFDSGFAYYGVPKNYTNYVRAVRAF